MTIRPRRSLTQAGLAADLALLASVLAVTELTLALQADHLTRPLEPGPSKA